jgi:phosphoribosylglycinamide formyltransferase-1
LVSGGGTNLQAIIDAVSHGRLNAEIAAVVSDRPGTRAVERAVGCGIPTAVHDRKSLGPELSAVILDTLGEDLDLIILAGFLAKITEPLLGAYRGRIINIHPALLPNYGGAGMYGRHVHEAVLAAGDRETGCTVHFVDEGMDTGDIILQKRMPVYDHDTPDTLAARLRPLEQQTLIEAIHLVIEGSAEAKPQPQGEPTG